MKRYRTNHITNILAIGLMAGGLAACHDDMLYEADKPGYDSDHVLFEAFIGAIGANTRSGEDPTDLDPLVLQGEGRQLYLHTYICDNSFDPVDMHGKASTRGTQIQNMDSLKKIHGKFGLESRYADSFEEHLGLTTASPIVDTNGSESNVWKIDGNRVYWPAGDAMVSFHAWAPSDLTKTGMTTSLTKTREGMSFSYTAQKSTEGENKDAEVQTDLLLARVDASKKRSNGGKAALQFTHPLAAVKFAVRDVLGGTVESITLRNIYSKGDCKYTLTADDNGYYTNTSNGGYEWTNQGEKTSFTQEFGVDVTPVRKEDGTYEDVPVTDRKPSATFMMIPQDISADAEIEIVMTQKNLQDANGNASDPSSRKITLKGKINDGVVTEWKAGKEYVYTISTSSENWTYVFDVMGSYRAGTEVYMPCPADDKEFYVGDYKDYVPYYTVISYRMRANNPNITEPMPWSATHGNGKQYYYNTLYDTFAEKDAILYVNRQRGESERPEIESSIWMTDEKGLSGEGGEMPDKHIVSFYTPTVTTNWNGDIEMYLNEPYEGNAENNPWDLSTFGGQTSMNTANCYVVDRTGWYSIPLYYGNAIKNGNLNIDAIKKDDLEDMQSIGTDGKLKDNWYLALKHFKDHKGGNISEDGVIPATYYSSAHLLWQDAYQVVDEVKLVDDKIVFHVNKDNIQQGNAVIGLSEHTKETWDASDPRIVWSWHIWINEHWLNKKGISNAFSNEGFTTSLNSVSQMQQQGDLKVTVPKTDTDNRDFYVTPYNIGWCDAKHVRYLSRYSKMDFVQYKDADKKEYSGETAQLELIQDGRTIEYLIGNNVYFQFGRKDPFVGFRDETSTEKEEYGELKNDKSVPQLKSLSYSIQHPNQLFVGAIEHTNDLPYYNDWCNDDWGSGSLNEYYNLWNYNPYDKRVKHSEDKLFTRDEYYTVGKTVYDPSPAGYAIPPIGFFKILFKKDPVESSRFEHFYEIMNLDDNGLNNYLNGQKISDVIFRINTRRGGSEFFTLTANGNKWWAKKRSWIENDPLPDPGGNFNGHIVYLWSSTLTKVYEGRDAFGMALGNDGGGTKAYLISAGWPGKKALGRAIRCIRE